MEVRDKVKKLFSYLLSIKNINQKIIRNVFEYSMLYWESDLFNIDGCFVNKESNKEWWLCINKKAKKLYDKLFKIYLEFRKKPNKMEFIWGHGLFTWYVNGEKLQHPIFITKMRLEFDVAKCNFILKPINKTYIELGFFDRLNIPNLDKLIELKENYFNKDIDPRNIENIEDILNQFVNYLSPNINPNGEIQKNITSIKDVKCSKNPVFYDLPVIIVRKNDNRLWQQEIKNVINEIDKGYNIPKTIEALVENKEIKQDDQTTLEWKDINKHIYFPLSANTEQKEIVNRLSNNFGVVVQGPPGTGKSHTIVNLICHLLAQGKRVLVTSETERALKVLYNKIPKEIRELCITMLGDDNNSLKVINKSVKNLTDILSLNIEKLHKDISFLENEIYECKKRQYELFNKLIEEDNFNNESINYFGKQYRIKDIAIWVRKNKEEYSWIKDDIGLEQKSPITNQGFSRFIKLLSKVERDKLYKMSKISNIADKLPVYEEINNKMMEFLKLKKEYCKYKEIIKNWYVPENNNCDYNKTLDLLIEAKNKMEYIEKDFFKKILYYYNNSTIAREVFKTLYLNCSNYLNKLSSIKKELNNHKIQIPKSINIDKFNKDFNVVYNELKSKGKLGKIFKVLHNEYEYIIEECKVDYKPINMLKQGEVIKLYIEKNNIIRDIRNLWNNTIKDYDGSLIQITETINIIQLEEYIKKLNYVVNWDKYFKNQIIKSLGKIQLPKYLNWYKSDTYDYLIQCICSIKSINKYEKLNAYMEILKKIILTTGELEDLYEAINECDLVKLNKAYKNIENLKKIKKEANEINTFIKNLKNVCPKLLKEILCAKELNIYKDWDKAWQWKKWDKILQKFIKIDFDDIQNKIKIEKIKEKTLIEDTVSKKAWYNQILRVKEPQKRSFFSWLQAMKRIGKGTGKFVCDYKKIAKNEMTLCENSIPVWIMPLNKVIENISLSNEQFDVVIFDESSQSNIFALCALMRAKKAIIVGDDKQISPEIIGVDQTLIQQLLRRYLKGIPNFEWFDLYTSIYDTALRVFPDRLMLKEHFRCVPEIIRFSNKLCYSNEIIPLRYSTKFEKIYPPIIPFKVNGGKRDPIKCINVLEAETLVDKIIDCCNDERYEGMTMGVISLLGEAQGELIQDMLIEKIGEEEMIKRKLICGDSYCFQGDERDIMFLSMVISDDVKFTALTKESDVRRFNVAASRAKNQMWVFYSIDLGKLNPKCVRYSLLKYCLNYKNYNFVNKSIGLVFQSEFQKDVYRMIKSKGYKVFPQVKVGKHLIDFVIQGSQSKMAVICENNINCIKYNIDERLQDQICLEQCGWIFYKINKSEFYYNPEKTMKKLIDKFDKVNIKNIKNKYNFKDESIYKDKVKVV